MSEVLTKSQRPNEIAMAECEVRPRLSVIIPVFNEAGNVQRLHEQICQGLKILKADFEVIYVDDRSTDGTLNFLRDISSRIFIIAILIISAPVP